MEANSTSTYKGLEDETLGMEYYFYERNVVIWRVFINCKCKHIRTVHNIQFYKNSDCQKYTIHLKKRAHMFTNVL